MKRTLLHLAALAAALPAAAGTSTLGEGDSYAWAANLGWIEMIPNRPAPGDGVIVTDTRLSGFAWSDSTGWLNFGDGTPGNFIRYSNSTGTDSGVNHDGAGNLSGLAWSANLGWINFGWAAPANANRPRFDLISGGFTGYAWCPNAGWINLGAGLLKTDSICRPDADGDGISDAWEIENAEIINILTATGDNDGDGVSDKDEYYADTHPLEPGDHLEILQFIPGTTGSTLTWTSRPTRLYRIAQSTDLQSWTASLLNNILPDAGASTTRPAHHDAGPRRFFRVQAIVPLQK
jgi:Bacterial TSP3 repeat